MWRLFGIRRALRADRDIAVLEMAGIRTKTRHPNRRRKGLDTEIENVSAALFADSPRGVPPFMPNIGDA